MKKPQQVAPVLFDGSGGGRSEAGWHAIESMFRCPKAYQFQEVRGLKAPVTHTPDHFTIGILFHAARARWFVKRFDTSKKTFNSILEAVEQEVELAKLPMSADAIERTMEIVELYVEHWSKRPAPKPVAAEYKLGPSPFRVGDPFFLHRTARLDDASYYPEAGDQLMLGESKTTSGDISDVVSQYTLHGQTMLQMLLWKMAPQGEAMHGKAAGVVMDVVKKPYSKVRAKFERVPVFITDQALQWFSESLARKLRDASGVEWDSEVERNVEGCTYGAGRARVVCAYRELCQYGKRAAGQFVSNDGTRASLWSPKQGQTVPPWR